MECKRFVEREDNAALRTTDGQKRQKEKGQRGNRNGKPIKSSCGSFV